MISGSTKLSMKEQNEFVVTSASKCTCPARGTCLLQHVNLGACNYEDIPSAYRLGMSQLCDLHSRTGVGQTGEYLDPSVDRQVGLGVLGLANLLRRYNVTYEQFGRALEQYNSGTPKATVAYELVARRSLRASRKPQQIAREQYGQSVCNRSYSVL